MAVPLEPLETPQAVVAGTGTTQPVSKRQVAGWLAAYVGAFVILLVPVISTLALKIAEIAPDSRADALGVIAGIGGFAALVANPVFGALSDRTTSRFGMRRPWVVGGTVCGVAALVVLALGQSLLVVGVAWVFVQLCMNAVLAALAAFLPDRVPESQRGKVSALAGIFMQLAPMVGLALANGAAAFGGTPAMFVGPSVVGVILIAVYVLTARDRVLSSNLRASWRWSTLLGAFAFNPRRNPDFGWAWFGRFFITLAFAASSTYQVYFLNDRLGIPMAQVATYQMGLFALSLVMISFSAGISGVLSDRTGRRKVFVFIASGLIATASLVTAFSTDLTVYIVAGVISGLATGAYFAVDLALVTDVLPDKDAKAAKDMGVFNIANTLPQSLAPALAPLLLAIGTGGKNYTALFIAAAVVAVVGALTVIPIRKVR